MDSGFKKAISQMVIAGFRGTGICIESPFFKDLKTYQPGGVILFDYDLESRRYGRNIESPDQLKVLVDEVKRLSETPLIVAIDQEGGKVARLKERYGFPSFESAEYIGKEDSEETTEKWSSKIAATLKSAGINYNCAPSVDLNLNPGNPVIGGIGRSFSADTEIVVKHASIFIDTLRSYGIFTSIKHFPGHGSSEGDTHNGMVDVTDCWEREELEPFRSLINTGYADMVMTSHIFNRKLDADYPATLSEKIISGVLRKELGFKGVVISDDMQMGAIRDHYGFEESVKLAINAGVDIVTFGNNLAYDESIIGRFVNCVEKYVATGAIKKERINESFERIKELKKSL